MYGGTLITISGSNFGTEATDNPVQLSGGINCYVESTSESEIQCRVDSDFTNAEAGSTGSIVVFLKLSEEAECSVCENTLTFTGNVPVIESVSVDFDTTELEWVVTVDGTDFTGDTSSTTYSVNGADQETMSVSSTQAKFKLTDISSRTITGAKLLFDIGKPKDHSLIEESFSITPKTQTVTPHVGSAHG